MSRFPQVTGLIGFPLFLLLVAAAHAQFKEIGPPPFSKAVAHQRMRAILEHADSGNPQRTIDLLNSLVPWFRDVLDEELISAWQRDARERLVEVIEPLADPVVADAVVAFSWHSRTVATLNPAYAPMLGQLMKRYSDSGKEFLSDLLSGTPPQLGPLQEETVCRILIDMPDFDTWSQSALVILPHYRSTAERLLLRDRDSTDMDKVYRAQMWLAQLRGVRPGSIETSTMRRRAVNPPVHESISGPMLGPSPGADFPPPDPSPAPASRPPVAPAPAPSSAGRIYNGPVSGTLECTGNPVPQNAEYVFRNLPPLQLQLDYDRKIWDARLMPAENQSQRLILRNKSTGPQKHCVVHWSVIP